MKKLLAVLLALSMVCVFAACGAKEEAETTEPETEVTGEVTEEATEATEESTEEATEATEATEASETAEATSESKAEESKKDETKKDETKKDETKKDEKKVPSTKEEIIEAYTAVMNQAKKDAPGYTKVEWQELPDDAASRQVSKGAGVVDVALKAANSFVTTEEKAKSDENRVKPKGGDMHEWPVCNTPCGSMLTAADAKYVKSAKCEVLSDGNYKITIVLNPEDNPEPAANGATTSPSITGKVFGPLSKKDIDDTLTGNKIVTAVAKDITYTLNYHDCTAVLVYNPENNHVVSLDMGMKVAIKGSGTVAFIQLDIDKQELIDTMKIYDLKY